MNRIKTYYENYLAYYEISNFLKNHIDEKTIIVCIGTDKCIGDCLGPLVGTLLKNKFFPLTVFGTLDSPIHALNLDKKITEILKSYPGYKIIAIDACLGDPKSIGEIHIRNEPVYPGKGVGKTLRSVGDISIIAIVDSYENIDSFTSRPIRLSFILDMSKVIVDSLMHAYYLKNKKN
ncbi:spore protease YyaC [Clostridium sp.]|uniref:spore protease YyaC n=1 Tax=Clostridium sp. TaxID=1506 RepID=UPI00262B7DC8